MSRQKIRGIRPTRIELLKIRKRIVVAEKGHELLQEKLDTMVIEFFRLREMREDLRRDAEEAFAAAYPPLQRAGMVMGLRGLNEALSLTKPAEEIRFDNGMVMGTSVPAIFIPDPFRDLSEPGYSLSVPSAHLDVAYRECETAVKATLALAELEGSLVRLADQITITRRRVNALANLLIPSLYNTAAYIEDYLEEIEREDLFRRKRAKLVRSGG
ncbi:V-type ATP synthase subunit D [Methanogenium organophilum]|uniref:A-type ATP synthase subunit D n=1 Tax=Methanogenium organophilum TaxID=2199 RepID=A0A9X9S511_METOG|nr:V-type ATP synthase subunit D [Methanogenium organophilum]WAI01656.1 V-type ATP synthase subunit D [Methanogenium organophilum]